MKTKTKIAFIGVLLLVIACATVTTASASTKSYTIPAPTGTLSSLTVTNGNTAEIYYTPNAVGTRTFTIGSKLFHTGYIGTVEFFWTETGEWHSWRTAQFGYGSKAVSQSLYSGNTNVRYKMVVKPLSIVQVYAKATIQ